jgi:hypothetical protein
LPLGVVREVNARLVERLDGKKWGTRHVATQYRAGNSVKLKLAHAMFVREAYSK